MGRPQVWDTLPSFRMWPKKTFFGLDKNRSHCFTLPKDVTKDYIRYFALDVGSLQREISFMINGSVCAAKIRLIRINRTKPYKLRKDELKQREVVQFQWPNEKLTITAFRNNLEDAIEQISSGQKNESSPITFHHKDESTFLVNFD